MPTSQIIARLRSPRNSRNIAGAAVAGASRIGGKAFPSPRWIVPDALRELGK